MVSKLLQLPNLSQVSESATVKSRNALRNTATVSVLVYLVLSTANAPDAAMRLKPVNPRIEKVEFYC